MKAFAVDLLIEQGATFSKTYTWKAGSPATPVNLTGCSAVARFRVTDPASKKREVVQELSTVNGGIVLGDDDGTIRLVIAAVATATFAWDKADWQLYVTHADGSVTRLMQGVAEVDHSV